MARLEVDMENRMCGTIDDMTVSTEMDLERDEPEFVEEEHYLIGHS